jgi:two-component system chemotaxis response regulator CheB
MSVTDPIQVLIVDDSRLFRSALEEALEGHADIAVAGSVFNGAKALEFIRRSPPDVVTLDVEMPGMDGLAALQHIEQFNKSRPDLPPVGVIMVSAFTHRGAQVTVAALQAGAFDFVTKPSGPSRLENLATLGDELVPRIRACARRRRQTPPAGLSGVAPAAARRIPPAGGAPARVRALAIAASTGGPQALSQILPPLCARVDWPMLIVQHMPAAFTRSLAESLSRQVHRGVAEAGDGQPLKPGQILIAPGGRHLLLRGSAAAPVAGLTDQPPENHCRPSADVLFRSAAAVLGREVVAVILTGMGCDGTAGLQAVKRAGGYIIAQDEASSVVWGMPGSAVVAGAVHEILPLSAIPGALASLAARTS